MGGSKMGCRRRGRRFLRPRSPEKSRSVAGRPMRTVAVNEAARIEALCASLDQKVIVSWAFHEAAGNGRNRLVSLGRYAMKGVARRQELFTLDPGG
jgi:class 3 adenylate cyclase